MEEGGKIGLFKDTGGSEVGVDSLEICAELILENILLIFFERDTL